MNNKVLITVGVVATILIMSLLAVSAYLFGQQRALVNNNVQEHSKKIILMTDV